MLRRTFLTSCAGAALMLAGCTAGTGTVSVADIILTVQTNCKFKSDVQSITAVIATLVAGFNVALGAGATVAAAVAKQVEDMICAAVAVQLAQMKVTNKSTDGELVVVVNGVLVHGTLVS